MPASNVCGWRLRFSASWQPAVADRASSSIELCANVEVGDVAAIRMNKLQLTVQRSPIPPILSYEPRNEQHGHIVPISKPRLVQVRGINSLSSLVPTLLFQVDGPPQA